MNDEMSGSQPQASGPIVEFVEQLLAEVKAGKVACYSLVWVGANGVRYQNFGGAPFPMYMALHECAETWRKMVFQPAQPSAILRPAGPLPPDSALKGNRP